MKLDKIVVNMGVGEAKENVKVLDSAVRDLEIITGQHAVITKSKHVKKENVFMQVYLQKAQINYSTSMTAQYKIR